MKIVLILIAVVVFCLLFAFIVHCCTSYSVFSDVSDYMNDGVSDLYKITFKQFEDAFYNKLLKDSNPRIIYDGIIRFRGKEYDAWISEYKCEVNSNMYIFGFIDYCRYRYFLNKYIRNNRINNKQIIIDLTKQK